MIEEEKIRKEGDLKKRIISWAVMAVMFITIWYMLDIVLLTFVITFVFYHLVGLIQKKRRRFFLAQVPDGFILIVLYLVFILLIIFASIVFVPKLALQFTDLANIIMTFDMDSVRKIMDPRLAEVASKIDFDKYLAEAGTMLAGGVATVGGFGINLFLSLILSFLILLEKKKIRKFGERLSGSRISFMYDYWIKFGTNFVCTFGKVMKVQLIIATINSVVSMIILATLGFPQIMSLGVMIFLLGLIPVAGMVISFVPLSIIAFNIGGVSKVVAVILMIVLVHAIEAYILNPKLMSDQTELPVCFIFIILLVGEHYMGVWGLLIGVPIFIFLLNAMEVDYSDDSKSKKHKDHHNLKKKKFHENKDTHENEYY